MHNSKYRPLQHMKHTNGNVYGDPVSLYSNIINYNHNA